MAKNPTLLHALKEKRQRLWSQHQAALYVGLHKGQPEYVELHKSKGGDWPGDPHELGFPPGGYDMTHRGPPPSDRYEWTTTLAIIRGQIQGINYAIFLIGEGFK